VEKCLRGCELRNLGGDWTENDPCFPGWTLSLQEKEMQVSMVFMHIMLATSNLKDSK
jgi:hypothetical protein